MHHCCHTCTSVQECSICLLPQEITSLHCKPQGTCHWLSWATLGGRRSVQMTCSPDLQNHTHVQETLASVYVLRSQLVQGLGSLVCRHSQAVRKHLHRPHAVDCQVLPVMQQPTGIICCCHHQNNLQDSQHNLAGWGFSLHIDARCMSHYRLFSRRTPCVQVLVVPYSDYGRTLDTICSALATCAPPILVVLLVLHATCIN